MPEILEIVGSDDEYQDAVTGDPTVNSITTNTPAATAPVSADAPSSNKVILEDLIKQQENLQLGDDNTENYKSETASGGITVKEDETSSTAPVSADAPSSNKVILEDLIKQQENLQLSDDNTENYKSETASGGITEKDDETSTPEYIHEHIDEAELAEKEKSMTAEELEANQVKANKMKLEANDLFKNDRAEEAIDTYTEALKICPLKATKERAILYGNRAAAKIKLDSKKSALQDCSKAIELWPDYVRALIRRAKLYEHEDKLDEALADYKHVYDLDPGQNDAREAMVRLPPIIQERNELLKEEMLGKLKDLGNMFLKPFGLSTSNFQMQQDPNSGSYSINFNQNSS